MSLKKIGALTLTDAMETSGGVGRRGFIELFKLMQLDPAIWVRQ
jgi:hypothetical protein